MTPSIAGLIIGYLAFWLMSRVIYASIALRMDPAAFDSADFAAEVFGVNPSESRFPHEIMMVPVAGELIPVAFLAMAMCFAVFMLPFAISAAIYTTCTTLPVWIARKLQAKPRADLQSE